MTPLDKFKGALAELVAEGLTQGEALLAVAEKFGDPTAEGAIAEAREQCDDDLEIDDVPLLSRSDDGWWVGAWIYVADAQDDEADEEEPSE